MLHDFLLCITANQTANQHKVCCSDGVQNDRGWSLMTYHFFQYTAAVNSILQFVQTNSAERLMLNSHSVYWMWNSSCYLRQVALLCTINLMNFSTDMFSRKRHRSVPKSQKVVQAFWRYKQKMWAFKRSGLTFLDHPVEYLYLKQL